MHSISHSQVRLKHCQRLTKSTNADHQTARYGSALYARSNKPLQGNRKNWDWKFGLVSSGTQNGELTTAKLWLCLNR